MKEYKKDLRYKKTHEAIQLHFRELLKTTPYEKISVTSLAKNAGINRKTFYLHYGTLDDLLQELGREIVSKGTSRVENFTLPQDLRKLIFTIYAYWESLSQEDTKIFRLNLSSANVSGFTQHMRDTFTNFDANFQGGDPKMQKVALAFIVYSMGVFYREWTLYHTVSTLEEAVDLAYTFITNGIGASNKASDL